MCLDFGESLFEDKTQFMQVNVNIERVKAMEDDQKVTMCQHTVDHVNVDDIFTQSVQDEKIESIQMDNKSEFKASGRVQIISEN